MKGLWTILLLLCMLLTGCGGGSESKDKTTATRATTARTETTEATKKENVPDAQMLCERILWELAESNLLGGNAARYLLKQEQLLKLTVLDCEADSQKATLHVRVSAPNLYDIVQQIQAEPFTSADEVDALMCERMDQATYVETDVEVQFVCEEDVWDCVFTEELADACYGGLFRFRNEYTEQNGGTQ